MASGSLLVNPPNARLPLVDVKTGAPARESGGLSILNSYADAINGTRDIAAPGVKQNTLGNGMKINSGSGSPEGVVTGSPGDFYTNQTGGAGTTLYVKETGTATNTGWVAK